MLKFYGYSKCATSRKAKKALRENGIAFEEIDITERPPAVRDFQKWLLGGDIELRQLFNTSGVEYRKVKDKIKSMSQAQVLRMLNENGKLIKRPIITDGRRVTVGFRDPERILAVWK